MSLRQVNNVKKILEMKQGDKIKEKEEIEEIEYQQKKQKSFFANFDMDEDEDEEEEEQKPKKQEKQKAQESNPEKKKKKKKKKKAAKKEEDSDIEPEQKETNMQNEQNNEFLDNLLKTEGISTSQPSQQQQIDEYQQQLKQDTGLESILEINTKKLNYNKELKKYFKESGEETSNKPHDDHLDGLNAKQKKRIRHLQNTKSHSKARPQHLSQLKDRPLPAQQDRYNCSQLPPNQIGQRVFSLSESDGYAILNKQYASIKNSHDPNHMFDFYHSNPGHAQCIYDCAEFLRLQGNYKESNQLLEQLLSLYESSFSVDFQRIFNDTNNQYSLKVTSSSDLLFKSLLKFIDILTKKGCYQAALEYNKFLIKLNPTEDPEGALLSIDYTCLISRNYSYLLHFVQSFTQEIYKTNQFGILYLPNFIYSTSLAKFLIKSEGKEHSHSPFTQDHFNNAISFSSLHTNAHENTLLLTSILLYPAITQTICNQSEGALKQLALHPFFTELTNLVPFYPYLNLENDQDIAGMQKVMEIYPVRNQIIWKKKEVQQWLISAIHFLYTQIDEQHFDYNKYLENTLTSVFKIELPFNLSRYSKISKSDFSDEQTRVDLNNIEDNGGVGGQEQNNQNYNPINMNQNALGLLMNSLLPWNNLPNQQPVQQQDQHHQEEEWEDENGFFQ